MTFQRRMLLADPNFEIIKLRIIFFQPVKNSLTNMFDEACMALHFGFYYLIYILIINGLFQIIRSGGFAVIQLHVYVHRIFTTKHLLFLMISVMRIKL